jgi:rRNA-processing protein FCF1
MDADCLIKLTKAGLKEQVCEAWKVVIPAIVRRETTEQAPRMPDAARIKQNIADGRIAVNETRVGAAKGEEAALRLYQAGGFDAVASDDARFIRQLRGLGVPYAVPAVIVVRLCRDGSMAMDRALEALASLRPHISPDQHAAAVLMISGGIKS